MSELCEAVRLNLYKKQKVIGILTRNKNLLENKM